MSGISKKLSNLLHASVVITVCLLGFIFEFIIELPFFITLKLDGLRRNKPPRFQHLALKRSANARRSCPEAQP